MFVSPSLLLLLSSFLSLGIRYCSSASSSSEEEQEEGGWAVGAQPCSLSCLVMSSMSSESLGGR
ncbi:hypothetical protein EYF80_059989 [Liparis tanakae]|uniref:Secreted protein n=1 Tax=Liparis tanakae TaxID=230148 RepID=A0A4Z2ENA6_9TELE|nr:hypothetical protein EYF80_059989 [Liparis tanakae]